MFRVSDLQTDISSTDRGMLNSEGLYNQLALSIVCDPVEIVSKMGPLMLFYALYTLVSENGDLGWMLNIIHLYTMDVNFELLRKITMSRNDSWHRQIRPKSCTSSFRNVCSN